MSEYSEDAQVEQPAIELFADLGWQTVNAYEEVLGINGTLGRETQQEVVLTTRLKEAMQSLNILVPNVPLGTPPREALLRHIWENGSRAPGQAFPKAFGRAS